MTAPVHIPPRAHELIQALISAGWTLRVSRSADPHGHPLITITGTEHEARRRVDAVWHNRHNDRFRFTQGLVDGRRKATCLELIELVRGGLG